MSGVTSRCAYLGIDVSMCVCVVCGVCVCVCVCVWGGGGGGGGGGGIKHGITFDTDILPRSWTTSEWVENSPTFQLHLQGIGIENLIVKNNFLVYIPISYIAALSKLREFNIPQIS